MTQRQLYPNRNEAKAGLPSREVWRLETGAGRVILFETMEEVYFERRSPPYGDWTEILPILRAMCECNTMVHVSPKKWTLILEGFTEHGGPPLETVELAINDSVTRFGDMVGHRFGSFVKSVRVAGWWADGVD